MNNQSPFNLFTTNRSEFLNKKCAICWSILFYPELNHNNNKMVHCCKLECGHMFHNDCINKLLNANHFKCPECRIEIDTNKIISIDRSIEIAIRSDAFDHGNIDETLLTYFKNSSLQVADYPYHKAVFERWNNERVVNNYNV